MSDTPKATRIGDGVYRVVLGGHTRTVWVAGPQGRRWAFADGRVYREQTARPLAPGAAANETPGGPYALSAPMPATVLKVFTTPGARVTKGETLVILEAMKMELPLRATADGVVQAVHCREGQLVPPETVLVELA